MTSKAGFPNRRVLPKLMACMTKNSLENLRNKALFSLDILDAKGIRRRKLPLHECLILELKESGFTESSDYLQDLIYDNIQLVTEDDIGIVVDLRNREDYLEHICAGLQRAEKERDKENTKKECLELLKLAIFYAEKGKGILWLAEKFFLASIAVSSQYLVDGGRQKGCCKYHYSRFLLDKFPGADPEEPFLILTEVRNSAIGKRITASDFRNINENSKTNHNRQTRLTTKDTYKVALRYMMATFAHCSHYNESWPLYESEEDEPVPPDTVFGATAIQLHRVLLSKARAIRKQDTGKSERLSRLAERRAKDADETAKTAEAIIEIGICQLMMNNLNNAQKTFDRALKIHTENYNADGLCVTKMHMAAVMQRLGDHESAARLLTEMGAMAMEHGLRRQLGQALHLLGELHLRRERPELGTQHLSEAFACFMGFGFQKPSATDYNSEPDKGDIEVIYKSEKIDIFEEEAEQSRLMMAISAGQELMASYFNLIREANNCAVSQMKTIEWKLSRAGWWVKRQHHEFLPCMCQVHQRTPLDVLRNQLELKAAMENLSTEYSQSDTLFGRIDTTQDIRKLRSSFQR